MLLKNFLLVGLGGMVGSMLRYACYLLLPGGPFPLATFTVNIAGSFIIGLVMGVAAKSVHQHQIHLLLATGLCGGFTTFSAFSADGMHLASQGKTGLLVLYAIASVVLCMLATYGGYKLVTS